MSSEGNSSQAMMLRAAVAVCLSAALFMGCGQPSAAPRLLLYCGAGIRPPVAEAVEVFGKEHGVTIECDYAGSNVLLSKLKLARAGDLYMPGENWYLEQAEKEGLVSSKRTVCYFVPVILVQKGNPRGIKGLSDLVQPGMRLGLGDPQACAVGRASAEIFAKNGISPEAVKQNLVFSSLTVNELGLQIKAGQLDAVIVWQPIAMYYADSGDIVPIPPDRNVLSTVSIATLTFSKNKTLAEEFIAFLTSDTGRAIFTKHSYATEPPAGFSKGENHGGD